MAASPMKRRSAAAIRHGLPRAVLLAAAIPIAAAAQAQNQPAPPESGPAEGQELLNLPIERLMDVEVTSVSKKPQRLADTAAAVYVITQEDIRRSGMTSVPELLRMVPGLDVAQSGSSNWSVSSRGFNGQFADKLLVLIDGRSVYTPVFSGVLWDMQTVPLQDIDRIEVIRGSGGTIWGANAVNGVINIITKAASETQGPSVSVTAGTDVNAQVLLQYGGKLSDNAYFRAYLKAADRPAFVAPTGGSARDEWRSVRAGVRLDWQPTPADAVSAQADYFRDGTRITTPPPTLVGPPPPTSVFEYSGATDAVVSWNHRFSAGSDVNLQVFFERDDIVRFVGIDTNTYDVEFRHNIQLDARNQLTWGVGYRRIEYSATRTGPYFFITPPTGANEIVNVFAQDEVTLTPSVHLIGGIKIEHNLYTGWEHEPSLRLSWKPTANQTLWAAVSGAVRTPSIGEQFARTNFAAIPANPPLPPALVSGLGNPDAAAERVTSWELGYRAALTDQLSIDVAAYYNRYTQLTSITRGTPFIEFIPPPPHLVYPAIVGNLFKGDTYGGEASVNWQATRRWRLFAGYSLFAGSVRNEDPTTYAVLLNALGDAPRHQIQLRSHLDLPARTELDAAVYYVGALHHVDILTSSVLPAYTRLDLRFGWRPTDRLSLSLQAQNLLQPRHAEFTPNAFATAAEVPRSVSFTATVGF